jgi:hypothetical protein
VNDGMAVEFIHGSHDASLEFLFGCDADVAQPAGKAAWLTYGCTVDWGVSQAPPAAHERQSPLIPGTRQARRDPPASPQSTVQPYYLRDGLLLRDSGRRLLNSRCR